jgi:hypothetical protein
MLESGYVIGGEVEHKVRISLHRDLLISLTTVLPRYS